MCAIICRFAEFELDQNAYQLRRNGGPVKLERIAFDLLFLLVDGRGQLITHEEILTRIDSDRLEECTAVHARHPSKLVSHCILTTGYR
jgi:DNA-binding winged helix-turn-helix (wHTH) protein